MGAEIRFGHEVIAVNVESHQPILTAKNEDKAAAELSEIYNDQFVVTKSTVGAVNDDFDITVQSEKSKIVYDFVSKDRDYSGEYYAENVNVKVNELIQPIVGEETMVMSNVFQDGLQEEIALEDAKVKKAAIHLLVEQDLTVETAPVIQSHIYQS